MTFLSDFLKKVHLSIVPIMTFGNPRVGIRKKTIRSHNVLLYQNRFWLVGICFQWYGTISFVIFIFFFASMTFMNKLVSLVFLL